MRVKKIKIEKKILISFSIISLLLITIISLAIYHYHKGFDSKILNDTEKSTEEEKNSEEDSKEDKGELTEEINDNTKAEETAGTDNTGNTNINSSNWWEYPDEILETERDGDDFLVLVNKKYKLPSTYIPNGLVKASEAGIRRGDGYYIRDVLVDDLTDLVNDIEAEGVDISIVSGYRSYSTQASTYEYWVNYNGGNIEEADKISARAGHSQHQLGTTIDFSTSDINDVVGSSFTDTNTQIWLGKNAYKYGFVLGYPEDSEEITGYSYESWHYRYIGKEYAQEMHDNGMILENYLISKNQ